MKSRFTQLWIACLLYVIITTWIYSRDLENSFLLNIRNVQESLSRTKRKDGMAEKKHTGPSLILFTTWIERAEKYPTYNATMKNWEQLRPFVQPVVFTNEGSVIEQVTNHSWLALPMQRTAPNDKPILKDMYIEIRRRFNKTPLIGYCNADILFTKGLIDTLFKLISTPKFLNKPAMIVGSRTNIDNLTSSEVSSWSSLSKVAKEKGTFFQLFWAIDYFIATSSYPFEILPDLAVGLPDYDNFMVWISVVNNITTVDTSNSVLAVHFTTESGNHESFQSRDVFYNRKIFITKYPDFILAKGFLHCTHFLTGRTAFSDDIDLFHRDAVIGNCIENPPLFGAYLTAKKLLKIGQNRGKIAHHKPIVPYGFGMQRNDRVQQRRAGKGRIR